MKHSSNSLPPLSRLVPGAAAWLVAMLFSQVVGAQPADTPAEVFRRLSADRWVSREITFADLGFTGPLVLGAPESRHEIYLPVPAHVPLSGGEIKLDANYMRADGGRTTFVVSLDSYPVSSRPFPLEKGDASVVLGVDGAARASGFVRLGLNWSTALGADWLCADARTPGNVLRIEPESRFTFRYDGSSIRDLTTAWGALPQVPVILISSNHLAAEPYDSAWRLGLALERAGKRSRIRILPAIGDTLDLDGITVPPALRIVPAFAALMSGGPHKLKDAAEVGAVLALGPGGPLGADIVVADEAMAAAVAASLDALRAQLQAAAPEAVASFAEWRVRVSDSVTRPLASREIQLAYAFGRPAILIAPDAGVQAAGLFSSYWNRVAVSPVMVVQAADEPVTDVSAVSLKYLGGRPGSFDVLSHADWNATFDIGAVSADGRLPGTLVVDVAASPSAASTPPVVSVFMNDILLGARQMDAKGTPERITAAIPRYSLMARNILRLSFVRQLASDRCRETPEAYPVAVLPSSHMLLKKARPTDDFMGMVSRYAGGAHVMVPVWYLADASNTLPRVIRLAATTGVSPQNARFTVVTDDATPAPSASFLALDLPFTGVETRVKLEGGRVVMASNTDQPLLDVSGLNRVGIIEVVRIGGEAGVIYRSVGADPPAMDKPILLAQGDVAAIGMSGVLTEINSADPSGRSVTSEGGGSWLLSRGYWWMVPILAIAFMLALVVSASRMRRRASSERNEPQTQA